MDEILKRARELGEMVSKHPYYDNLRQAEEAVQKDADARSLVQSFEQQQDKIMRLASERRPIEPEDKRRISDLQQRVMSHPLLKRLYAAQVDFKHLMDKLNRAIQEGLEGPEAAGNAE